MSSECELLTVPGDRPDVAATAFYHQKVAARTKAASPETREACIPPSFRSGQLAHSVTHSCGGEELMVGTNLSTDESFESQYHCTVEWHLARITNFASILYPFALRISKGSRRFFCSQEKLAAHFGVSRSTIRRAIKELVALGFFSLLAQEKFRPSLYRVLRHKEWVVEHPQRCAVKQTMPWSQEEGDPLGISFHNASGGRIKYEPYKLAALRNTGLSDDALVVRFEQFLGFEYRRRNNGAREWHGRWSGVHYRFLRWIKGELSKSELEQFFKSRHFWSSLRVLTPRPLPAVLYSKIDARCQWQN